MSRLQRIVGWAAVAGHAGVLGGVLIFALHH